MSKSYGMMVGCKDVIAFVLQHTQTTTKEEVELKERVLNRMRYEFDKDIPVPAKFHKGRYGHKYDTWTCGNCGAGVPEVGWKFCPNCGFAIKR